MLYNIAFPAQIITLRLTGKNLEIYYPHITGLLNPWVQRKINDKILYEVYKMLQKQGYYQDPRMEISGYYEVKNNQKNIVSISLIFDMYAGGAHGLRVIKSLTMDTLEGRFYTLQKLFRKNTPYIKTLSDLIQSQIEKREIGLIGEFSGIKEEQDFYIADKTLVVYFQLYEITPYAYGFPYFPISVYELKDIIDKQGPLGEMLH